MHHLVRLNSEKKVGTMKNCVLEGLILFNFRLLVWPFCIYLSDKSDKFLSIGWFGQHFGHWVRFGNSPRHHNPATIANNETIPRIVINHSIYAYFTVDGTLMTTQKLIFKTKTFCSFDITTNCDKYNLIVDIKLICMMANIIENYNMSKSMIRLCNHTSIPTQQ